VNQPGKFSAPLELAVAAGRLDAARWLLDHGARTDVAGEELPLVTAVRSCQPELVRLLIARGAAPLVHADVELGVAAERGCARVEWLRAALR
jgi:ankyrin repeat protein